MEFLKCKMCGGDVELSQDRTLGTCQYCGTVQTLPRVSDQQRAAIFNRGNYYRRLGDFDKAISVYEGLLQEDDTDAEAHWCCALCRFGIEYVKDPATEEYIPTCHRAGFESILEDVDYLAAVKHSHPVTAAQYTADAQRIDQVRKDILSVSQSAEQYDVFICYKESDEQGHRTPDSVKAQELYTLLTEKGIRVFYARFSLEDKVGQLYEPYIFAALHSARVMLLVASKPEYANAVWVKNEWSRFLHLMKKDPRRAVIPCCYNMPAEGLPEQFTRIQAVYLEKPESKVELLRAIDKLLDRDLKKAPVPSASGVNLEALLKRVDIFLADRNWESADAYCEKVLDQDPENSRAYFGKLLASLHVSDRQSLAIHKAPFDSDPAYRKAYRYASAQDQQFLSQCNRDIRRRIEKVKKETQYDKALALNRNGDLLSAASLFRELGDFRDSAQRAQDCHETHCRGIYDKACAVQAAGDLTSLKQALVIFHTIPDYNSYRDVSQRVQQCREQVRLLRYREACAQMSRAKTSQDYYDACNSFRQIPEYRQYQDAAALADSCLQKAEALREKAVHQQQKAQKKAKRKAAFRANFKTILILAVIAVVVFVLYYNLSVKPNNRYKEAVALLDAKQYTQAISIFEDLGNFKDAQERMYECYYRYAAQLEEKGKTQQAAICYGKAESYRDAASKALALWQPTQRYHIAAASAIHITAIKADGTIFNTGNASVSDFTDIIHLAGGSAGALYGSHAVGLRADGTVVATGPNSFSQCNVENWTGMVYVTAGSRHTVGLRADGTVLAVGSNADGQCGVSDWKDVVLIGAGTYHTVGVTADGKILTAGNNSYGQLDIGHWDNLVQIVGSDNLTAGLRADGTVLTAGDSYYDTSSWTDIVSIYACGTMLVGLKADGTVVLTGMDTQNFPIVMKNITAVITDGSCVMGITAAGAVQIAGSSDNSAEAQQWTGLYVPEEA